MLEKIKSMGKKAKLALIGAAMVVCAAVPVLASGESSGTANGAVVSAFTGVAGDMTATATALLPIALGVVGLILVVRYGKKFFNTTSSSK